MEQFQTPGWALDFHEEHVKARVIGPLPPGWASFGLMRSPVESSWYGCPARRGVLACTPPGEIIDGHISPGFQCLAVNFPPAVWERGRLLAGVERADFGHGITHLGRFAASYKDIFGETPSETIRRWRDAGRGGWMPHFGNSSVKPARRPHSGPLSGPST